MRRNKLEILVDGAAILERTVRAALTWANSVVVAGPKPTQWTTAANVSFVVEDPPFGGPAAGVSVAVESICKAVGSRADTLLLAGDLANPTLTVSTLARAHEDTPAPLALVDEDGWIQYLAGIYRLQDLQTCLKLAESEFGSVRNLSMRRLLTPLSEGTGQLALITAPVVATQDLDTPEDLRRHAARKF